MGQGGEPMQRAGYPLLFVWAVGVGFSHLGVSQALAQERKEETTVVVTQDGLRFKLPPDWPVEKRGGVVAPIPIEEYLARKFSALEERLRRLEQQMIGLELKVRVMEEDLKRRKEGGMRSLEESP